MVDLVSSARTGGEETPRPTRPPLRPSWLLPALTLGVVGVHVAFFASGVYWPDPQVADLGAINAELVPEGESLEAGELAPEGDSLDVEPNAEAAAPPEPEPEPVVEDPEAAAPPVKQKVAEKAKPVEKKRPDRRAVEKKEAPRAASTGRRYGVPGGQGQGTGTARVAGRYGLPGGRGQGAAATQAACLAQVAGSIRRHLPSVTSLGPGSANVTFYVNSGGGISGISVSASSPAHAALARRIVASSRGPATCGSAFASQHIGFE